MRSVGCKDHKDSVSSQRSSFTNVYLIHSAEKTWRLKRAYILTAPLSTWNKFAYEGMNVYSLAADGDCHWKRICHYALATKTNRVMMLAVLWKKMLLKSARNFDSVPWLSTHLSVFNFIQGQLKFDILLNLRTRQLCFDSIWAAIEISWWIIFSSMCLADLW